MSMSSFSKAYEEMTFTIKDADLDKLNDVLKDINVRECPWFEVQDRHGNKARYYREPYWIPCSERLPEEGKVVLWCNEKGSVFTTAITVRNDHSWAVGKRHRFSRVIAWMPLPSPYQPEEESE